MRSLAVTLLPLLILAACGNSNGTQETGSSGAEASTGAAATTGSSSGSGSSSGGTTEAGSTSGTTGAPSTTGHGASSGGGTEHGTSGGSSTGGSLGTTSHGGSSGGTTGAIDAGLVDAGPDAGEDAGSDAGRDGGEDAGFQSTARSDWPVFTNPSDNPVLSSVQLVTITFTGYPFIQQVNDFGNYVVGSDWIKTVGADYGVGTGTVVGTYTSDQYGTTATVTEPVTDTDIELWLGEQIILGTVPSPVQYPQILYMMYFPSNITVTQDSFGTSCSTFDGYHSQYEASVLPGIPDFSYAIVVDCNAGTEDELNSITTVASHELIESATDPYPITLSGYLDRDTTSPWVASQYFVEIGDVCEGQRITDADAGYTLQQIWSISAAADGGAPCIPVDPNRPYFGVSASPATVQTGAVGSTTPYTITGWSSGPIAPWSMYVVGEPGPILGYQPTVGWTAGTLGNGQSAQLSVGIPNSASSGDVGIVMIYSGISGTPLYSRWPVVVNAQ